MQFVIKLLDGRKLQGAGGQVIVADHLGGLLLLAYTMPEDVIVSGHRDEPSWPKYVADAGLNSAQPLLDVQEQAAGCMLAQIQPEAGGVVTFPVTSVHVYSDDQDPVISAVLTGKLPDLCHCAEDRWQAYCKRHSIVPPRVPAAMELT